MVEIHSSLCYNRKNILWSGTEMDQQKKALWLQRRRRVSEIIEVGTADDFVSRTYDFASTFIVIINLIVTVMYTFDRFEDRWGTLLLTVEHLTAVFFAVDYFLRVWTAHFIRPGLPERLAVWKYITSFTGIVDLLSWLPYCLPFFFPSGAAVFRMLRVVRVFRLFQINAYYDSINVISEVIASKRQQLASSVFIILVLMLASSLCMYSLEHEAQPEVFSNAFSGIWWSVSTLLTVGYGDIYPITIPGKIMGIIISFLGVGMVAIPTGIISAGFVDQYSRLKRMSEYAQEDDILFIKIHLRRGDHWVNRAIRDLQLPYGVIVAMVRRGRENIVPRGNIILRANDVLILGAEAVKDDTHVDLKEVVLGAHSPWNGLRIRDLDISRQTIILMVKRNGKVLVPKGELVLLEGDCVVLYTQERVHGANTIHI